jgi:hypothetical protein
MDTLELAAGVFNPDFARAVVLGIVTALSVKKTDGKLSKEQTMSFRMMKNTTSYHRNPGGAIGQIVIAAGEKIKTEHAHGG